MAMPSLNMSAPMASSRMVQSVLMTMMMVARFEISAVRADGGAKKVGIALRHVFPFTPCLPSI